MRPARHECGGCRAAVRERLAPVMRAAHPVPSITKPPSGDHLGIYGISRPRRRLRRRRFGTPGLLGVRRIVLRVVGPDVGFPGHAGAAAGIFDAPMIRDRGGL
jgi:hypothetical protein